MLQIMRIACEKGTVVNEIRQGKSTFYPARFLILIPGNRRSLIIYMDGGEYKYENAPLSPKLTKVCKEGLPRKGRLDLGGAYHDPDNFAIRFSKHGIVHLCRTL